MDTRLLPTATLILAACGSSACGGNAGDTGPCEDYATSAVEITGVLDATNMCQLYTLPVGEHAYVSVHVTEPEVPCAGTTEAGIALFSEPTYANFDGDGPKWTFDVVGEAPTDAARFDVACDDGTAWSALFQVVD